MKYGSFMVEPEDNGGSSGQAKRWVTNFAQRQEIC